MPSVPDLRRLQRQLLRKLAEQVQRGVLVELLTHQPSVKEPGRVAGSVLQRPSLLALLLGVQMHLRSRACSISCGASDAS